MATESLASAGGDYIKRSNIVLFVVILVVGVVAIASVLIYAYNLHKNTPVLFNSNKKTAAGKLYEKIKSIDLEANYPETPEAVMELYNDITLMLYGDMIVAEELFPELINIQRELLSGEILGMNTFDEQYQNLKDSLVKLAENKMYAFRYETDNAFFDENLGPEVCVISQKQFLYNMDTVYWNYNLQLIDSRWKITGWEVREQTLR